MPCSYREMQGTAPRRSTATARDVGCLAGPRPATGLGPARAYGHEQPPTCAKLRVSRSRTFAPKRRDHRFFSCSADGEPNDPFAETREHGLELGAHLHLRDDALYVTLYGSRTHEHGGREFFGRQSVHEALENLELTPAQPEAGRRLAGRTVQSTGRQYARLRRGERSIDDPADDVSEVDDRSVVLDYVRRSGSDTSK